jgi:type IV pilus assembly protein PilC
MGIEIHKVKKPSQRADLQGCIENLLNKELFSSSKMSDKDKENFYQYLATLVDSGIQLPVVLKLFSEEEISKKSKRVSELLVNKVGKGEGLSNAMQASGSFEPYEYYNIAVGEETGRIGEILIGLKKYYENKLRQSRKLKSVLVYPVVVLSISVIAVWFLMSYVVPLFVDVYKRFGGDLPQLTKVIIAISGFFGHYFVIIVLAIAALVVTQMLVKNTPVYKRISSKIILRLPVVGELVRQANLARFCNSMTLMLKSNITFIRSLEMSGKMMDFYPIHSVLPSITDSIMKGSSVNEAFSKHKIFDKQMVTLLKVGEEVNRLDEMFEKVGQNYEDKLNHNINIINTLIEPAIIIFLGLVIGFILIAMYLPLFNMGNQMVM